MRILLLGVILLCQLTPAAAQLFKKPKYSGIYIQWGYNREWYTKSDLHFSNGSSYDFTVKKARATDSPDFDGFWETPLDITIPQNSFRIGVYLNAEHTHAIELNFDHAKYVVYDYQKLRVTGTVHGEHFDRDTVIQPSFLHFEHTDGANFWHRNYVGQTLVRKNKKRTVATAIYKAGAGLVVPRSDVSIMGRQLNNKFHVAGYIASIEAGLRYYPVRNLFLELTAKTGYANYLNALTVEGGTAKHQFGYFSVTGLVGYDLHFGKRRKAKA